MVLVALGIVAQCISVRLTPHVSVLEHKQMTYKPGSGRNVWGFAYICELNSISYRETSYSFHVGANTV